MIYCRVENIRDTEWNMLLRSFRDANLYQTSAFAKNSKGGEKSEKFILYENNLPTAAALVRIKTFPLLNKGIAYIRWGPLWRRYEGENHQANFSYILASLRQEYSVKRKLLLRTTPNLIDSTDQKYNELFEKQGYSLNHSIEKYKTLIIDLKKTKEEIQNNFVKDWKRRLRRGFEKDLKVRIGTSNDYYHTFNRLYNEMRTRKKFKEYVSPLLLDKVQNQLSPESKMKILICSYKGEDIAAFVISSIGENGLALLAGSSELGLKLSASIMLHWKTIEWLKINNYKFYDLGGIDIMNNYPVYKFKKGSGAKEISFIGTFETCSNYSSKLFISAVDKIKFNLFE